MYRKKIFGAYKWNSIKWKSEVTSTLRPQHDKSHVTNNIKIT